ncbi:HlyD family secretion protein [Pseudoalteromonas sp. P1-9]|uniref:efflux RND transporter periplasmic adaptor subunit n=1 Tax=Pseudoalteromonas sp. P1-9 TaxID=1710354 RepID=UPI0006D62990|nr:HlyD family efflux transporter periplasmic adaptor subunit [Pseudoalteromonas sp. P1-9]KPV98241.1 HlyD family secretion protein [Pseudoalteromonas sp. P1-9]
MDIKQSLAGTNKKKRWPMPLAIILSLSLVVGFASTFSDGDASINRNELLLADVNSGPLKLTVSGFGQLRSKYSRFITARYQAQVEQVFHLPGSRVEKDTVILRLSNPTLEQQLNRARLTLARQKANFEALKLSQKSEKLNLEANLTLLESELANANLRAEAEQKLIEQGIVSTLDYKRSQLAVSQLSKRVSLAKQQLSQASDLHNQRLQVERELMREFELSFNAAQQDVDKLNVTAGINGMLQAVNVEQGQSVQMGAPLAVVGSEHQLLADLNVPEREASRIEVGQKATVNTFAGTVSAVVNRINPIVSDGRITVELELTGTLPSNARPQLTIEGDIVTDELNHTLYVRRPSFVSGDTQNHIFILNPDENQLVKTQVEFGKLAGDNIVINSGANAGDTLVISDSSDFKHLQTITITNN